MVSCFTEAKELFTSKVDFLEIYDDANSQQEDRYVAIGPLRRGIILVVYTERSENTMRILSARSATKRETELYRQYTKERS